MVFGIGEGKIVITLPKSIYAPGETISAADAADAFRRLNAMMGGWMIQPLTIPVTERLVFPLTANKGGPSNPYTIGPGGVGAFRLRGAAALRGLRAAGTTFPLISGPATFFAPFFTRGECAVG